MCQLRDRRTPSGVYRDIVACESEQCLARDFALHCGYSVMIFPGDAPGAVLPSGLVIWVIAPAQRCRVRRRKPVSACRKAGGTRPLSRGRQTG